MKQIDILCNDKIYTEMLILELEAQGYKALGKHTGYADIVVCESERRVGDNCITFSESEGADLLRPFNIEELVSLIEEKTGYEEKNIGSRELYVSATSRYAIYQGKRIVFTELEHRLLCCLYGRRNMYVSLAELAEELFGDPEAHNPVRVYVSYLRNKLDEAFGVKFIYTVRGKGYILKI